MIKIIISSIEKLPRKIKKQYKKNYLKKLMAQKPDTFEYSQKSVNKTKQVNRIEKLNDCDNLEFETHKLQFYEEDVEKMKTMTLKEEIEYLRKLKQQNKYSVIKPSKD